MGIIQLMAEFPSDTMKARWNNTFKVLKKTRKAVKAELYIQHNYYSKIKAKWRG